MLAKIESNVVLNVSKPGGEINPLPATLFYLHFHPPEVVKITHICSDYDQIFANLGV